MGTPGSPLFLALAFDRGEVIMKSKFFLRVVSLLALLVSLIPVSNAGALALADPPPADMFQLPWDLGIAWVAIDGLDNGTRRPLSSSHHFSVGGAIDFAPHNNMRIGENTSSFWVAAAASGTVIAKSFCHEDRSWQRLDNRISVSCQCAGEDR